MTAQDAGWHLPPGLPGPRFELEDPRAGRIDCYGDLSQVEAGLGPLLLLHSVNAAGSACEVRPLYEYYSARRPTYAFDLPGFGLSERSQRSYSPRVMTDAVHAVASEIRRLHRNAPLDAVALSLSSEYLARAATEDAAAFRTLALVSPTGFNGRRRRLGPKGSTRAVPGLHGLLSCGLWSDTLFAQLTRPNVIRYFLERAWGSTAIDEAMWQYDVQTVKQPGAKYAPLYFLAGNLFSNDISRLYESLTMPVWLAHGTRGDFVDYRGAEAMKSRPNWRFSEFETGALPHFEQPAEFISAYEAFLTSAGGPEEHSPSEIA